MLISPKPVNNSFIKIILPRTLCSNFVFRKSQGMANYVTKLKKGDKAPDFKAKDQNGNIISLNDFLEGVPSGKGEKLVLFFYPKDNTAGCINEVCNLRDNYTALKNKGFSIVGVSADDEKKHTKFIDKFDLPFPLIADTDKKMIEAYDVWGEKQFMGLVFDGILRTTFVIDEEGIIEQVITIVDTKNHTQQILEGKNERIKIKN